MPTDKELWQMLKMVYMERIAEDAANIVKRIVTTLPKEEWPEWLNELQILVNKIELDAEKLRNSVNN